MQDLCWTYAGPMLDHAGPMQDLCRTYAGPMQDLCWTYAGPMQDLCRTYAGPMQDLCRTYAGPMQDLCWTYAGPMLDLCRTYAGPMLDLCWTYAGPMLDLCRTYAGRATNERHHHTISGVLCNYLAFNRGAKRRAHALTHSCVDPHLFCTCDAKIQKKTIKTSLLCYGPVCVTELCIRGSVGHMACLATTFLLPH